MSYLDSEGEMKVSLQKACTPVAIPQGFKDQLREQLAVNSLSRPEPTAYHLWQNPRVVIPIMASVTAGMIGYGTWASWSLIPPM
jgi:hypothetical protein